MVSGLLVLGADEEGVVSGLDGVVSTGTEGRSVNGESLIVCAEVAVAGSGIPGQFITRPLYSPGPSMEYRPRRAGLPIACGTRNTFRIATMSSSVTNEPDILLQLSTRLHKNRMVNRNL